MIMMEARNRDFMSCLKICELNDTHMHTTRTNLIHSEDKLVVSRTSVPDQVVVSDGENRPKYGRIGFIQVKYSLATEQNGTGFTKMLGYVLLQYKEGELGDLQLSHIRTLLGKRYLEKGIPIERPFKRVGSHGEGFRLAAMALRRAPTNFETLVQLHFETRPLVRKLKIWEDVISAPGSVIRSRNIACPSNLKESWPLTINTPSRKNHEARPCCHLRTKLSFCCC